MSDTGLLDALRQRLSELDHVVVAFSGGADSALLGWVATDVLGPERARCVTAVSPSLPAAELADCERLAAEWGLNWTTVATDETERAEYVRNDADRCAVCKTALMDALDALVDAVTNEPECPGGCPDGRPDGGSDGDGSQAKPVVVLGVNTDDIGDHRPGQQAALARGARFPMVEAGLSKADVRRLSQQLGLRTWDKPQAACLASRVPYGQPVTVGLLGKIERAEAALGRLGFTQLRVRDYDDTARLEFCEDELAAAVAARAEVITAIKACGYRYVTIDLEGFRSGNLNAALDA